MRVKKEALFPFKKGQPPFVIAEVAQNHDGSLNLAHAFIDAVSKTGAQAIKFQTHFAEEESTPQEPWRVKFSYKDARRYDYWKRMEFSLDEWGGLKKHAEEKGLVFLSSPFSIKAVDVLEKLGVVAWKIGSGEVLSKRLIEGILKTKKPILISSGMSSLKEIDGVVSFLKSKKAHFALMQCTSSYPVPFEKVGVNMISDFKDRYDVPVGLSDHSGTIWPSLIASYLGAEFIELHVTLSRDMPGPDVRSSVTIDELSVLSQGIAAANIMRTHPVNKDDVSEELGRMRALFMKSVVAKRDIFRSEELDFNNMIEKKTGDEGGIPGDLIDCLVGLKIQKNTMKDDIISLKHLPEAARRGIKKKIDRRN